MSMLIVFLCFGLCYGCGSVETHASVRPGRSGDTVDSQFHRGRLLYKKEPRPSASSPKAITTSIADFTNLLLKDLTETIKTRMSLFPPLPSKGCLWHGLLAQIGDGTNGDLCKQMGF